MSDELTASSGEQANLRLQRVPDFEELAKVYRTIGEVIKAYLEPVYLEFPVFAIGPTPEADKARFQRILRPWPKWVLLLAAELRHVDFPTIKREVFYQTFRVLNVFIFRIPINSSVETIPETKRDACERIDIEVLPLIMASILGHGMEHLQACRNKLDDQLSKGEISPDDHASRMKILSTGEYDKMFRKFLNSWSADEKFKPFEMTKTVEEARRKTFDKHGRSKETQLTPIYRVMFHNWVRIENMSGPKELAVFLTEQGELKGYSKNPEGEIGRISTMCSRIGLKFRSKSKSFGLQRRHPSV